MKIQNSTQWCNLYSNASKYNINVRNSHYKLAVYSFSGIFIFLVIIVNFTFHYILAQSLAVVSIISLSVFLSRRNNEPIISSLKLTTSGEIYLHKNQVSYQLLPASRISFIGCWLVMVPNESILSQCSNAASNTPKQLFIYRDSLSNQDFSRLARVIKQLGEFT